MSDVKEMEPWERIQTKTFTKWCNNHLGREWGKATQIENILNDWESGILLMKLAVALYKENTENPEQAISMPKLRSNELAAKSRIQMVNNGNKALELIKTAGCKIRGVAAENLVDHDKVNILGMIWMIILDYAARGFGGTAKEVKKALLEWVNKKTDGYERVNPPGVKNFTRDWRSGLAFCALIHRHRPDLLNYDECLDKSNAENLELAFSVAEENLDIPRLLDVEDVDSDHADDKSIMTYVMEYFLAFAGEGLKEAAAKQAAEWLQFLREIRQRQYDYERRAKLLNEFCAGQQEEWTTDVSGSRDEATAAFRALRNFVGTVKPPQEMEKLDLEALFAEIQTLLVVNGLAPYTPPEELTPHAVEDNFHALVAAQSTRGKAVRDAKFSFIEKKEAADDTELRSQIQESFNHYDTNNSNDLNKVEFIAGCMEMSVALRNQEEKDALFEQVSGGSETVTLEQYTEWMLTRMVVKMDNKDSVKAAFKTIANNSDNLTESALNTPPLTDEDREFLKSELQQTESGSYDFNSWVDQVMA